MTDELATLLLQELTPGTGEESLDFSPGAIRETREGARDEPSLGRRIGPYTLVRQVGAGGMSVVFEAQQEEPVQRRVAIKLLRSELDSVQIESRFRAESRILACMEHPNIARIFDARTTENGQPYLVMEFVEGVAIDSYCDRRRLTNRQRLMLFVSVCNAVSHAHHKGVIHRDLKPSNILITEVEDDPVPKVIDFGVSKILELTEIERTLFTHDGQIVGTPQYMSPEQAGLDTDVDTRSDVYSLGAVLYQLLTGDAPLSRVVLRSASSAGDSAGAFADFELAEARLGGAAREACLVARRRAAFYLADQNLEAAQAALQRVSELGYRDAWAESDPTWDAVRDLPAFAPILDSLLPAP